MASYFRQVPDFDYVASADGKSIGDYQELKIFLKSRDSPRHLKKSSILYSIQNTGDDRPDNVAFTKFTVMNHLIG